MQATIRGHGRRPAASGAKCDLDLAVALYDVVRGVRRLQDDDPVDAIDAHLLVRVREDGPLRASVLATSVGLDLSTISRRLTRLEHQGLLVRDSDPDDARASRLALSQAGQRALGDVIANRAAVLHDALAQWDVAARTELAALLRRLADDLAESMEHS